MRLPRDNPMLKNIQVSKADMRGLLDELRDLKVTGYSSIKSPREGGVLLLLEGRVVGGFPDRGVPDGERSVRAIINLSRNGVIVDVYHMPREAVMALMTLAQGDPIFRGLRAEFTDLRSLLLFLECESFTGCVNVSSNQSQGIIIMESGAPSCGLYMMSEGLSWGSEALHRVLDVREGRIDVIREDGKSSVFTETIQLDVSINDKFGLVYDRGDVAWVDQESAQILGLMDGDQVLVSSIYGSAHIPCKVVTGSGQFIMLPRRVREEINAQVGSAVNVRRD